MIFLLLSLILNGFNKRALSLIYSYLKNRKQSLRINNAYSTLLELISGESQPQIGLKQII